MVSVEWKSWLESLVRDGDRVRLVAWRDRRFQMGLGFGLALNRY
ncbi:MAG: hypothetical protein AAF215_20040 [Cyanobacteria bacterium P01_A01_bin.123]